MKNCVLTAVAVVLFATSAMAERPDGPSTKRDIVVSSQSAPELGPNSSGGNVLVGLLLLLRIIAVSGGGGDGYDCHPYCAG